MKNKYLFILLIILVACEIPVTQEENKVSESVEFDISRDIIEIPSSLLPSSSRSGTSDALNIYTLIPNYIGSAESIRSGIEEIVSSIIENKSWIESIEKDVPHIVDGDENFKEFSVSETSGEYSHRISFYNHNSVKFLVIDFYIDEISSRTRGRVYLKESSTYNGTPSDVTLLRESIAEITFDAISESKTLEIRYLQPMGDVDSTSTDTLIGYANSLDPGISGNREILESLDLGQPERISIRVEYDGSFYRVSGYSYHPGLDTMHNKDMDIFYELFNPEDQSNRHTYLFKAITGIDNEGNGSGAKLYLSFPEDTLEDTSSVWVDDALGIFYGNYLTGVATNFLNDPDEDGILNESSELGESILMNLWIKDKYPKYTTGTEVTLSKWSSVGSWAEAIKTNIVEATDLAAANSFITGLGDIGSSRNVVKKEDIYLLTSLYNIDIANGDSPFTAVTWEGFKSAFFSDTANEYDKTYNLTTLSADQVNAYLNDSSHSDTEKEGVLLIYNLTTLIDQVVPGGFSGFTLTREELESFLSRDDLDSGAQGFADLYVSLNYIVNPAFYHPVDKFLGTYNSTLNEYYSYSGGSLALTATPSADMISINTLDGLSVSAMTPGNELISEITMP